MRQINDSLPNPVHADNREILPVLADIEARGLRVFRMDVIKAAPLRPGGYSVTWFGPRPEPELLPENKNENNP